MILRNCKPFMFVGQRRNCLLFPFRRQADESVLLNAAEGGGMGDGRITGARWTTGRWPGKDSLLFDRDTDFARVTIPGEHQELTIAAWVKVDRIDFVLNAILNSDGYEPGGAHLQVNRQGFVRGGVIFEGSFKDTFVGRPVPLGTWVHVASVISARTRSQQMYVNGALARERTALEQQHGRRVPLAVKIAPDLEDEQLDALAERALVHGMDAVIATNTTLSREQVQGQPHAQETGGLSGAPLRAASNRVIRFLRQSLGPDFPIVGVGGVMSADDAVEKIQAGANLVQIYTGLIYAGPALVTSSAQAIQRQAPSSG